MTAPRNAWIWVFVGLIVVGCNQNEDNGGTPVHEESLPAVTPEGTPPTSDQLDTLMHDTAVQSTSDLIQRDSASPDTTTTVM